MLYFYESGEFPELTGREREDKIFFAKIPVLAELSSYFQHSNKGNLRGEEVKGTVGALASLAVLIRGQSMSLDLPNLREKSPKSRSKGKSQVLDLGGPITKKAREGKIESTKGFIRFSDMLNNAHPSDGSEAGSPANKSPREKCNCNCHASARDEKGFDKPQTQSFSRQTPTPLFQPQPSNVTSKTQTPFQPQKMVLTPIIEGPTLTQINLFPKKSKKKRKPLPSSPGFLDAKF
jgi:hypothetical protein